MVKRQLVTECLNKQLRYDIPLRCKVKSKKQLLKVAEKLDFNPMIQFFESGSLGLKWTELPRRSGFKVVLFFALLTENFKDTGAFYSDDKIFDLSDAKTVQKLKRIKKILGHKGDIATISLEQIWEYAKTGGVPTF